MKDNTNLQQIENGISKSDFDIIIEKIGGWNLDVLETIKLCTEKKDNLPEIMLDGLGSCDPGIVAMDLDLNPLSVILYSETNDNSGDCKILIVDNTKWNAGVIFYTKKNNVVNRTIFRDSADVWVECYFDNPKDKEYFMKLKDTHLYVLMTEDPDEELVDLLESNKKPYGVAIDFSGIQEFIYQKFNAGEAQVIMVVQEDE